jgi:glycosyltransferase involved in cell wall biosynthesis
VKKRLRIAYLGIIDIAAEGAETRHVFEICEAWNRHGHIVTLFVPNKKGEPSEKLSVNIVRMQTFGVKRSFLLTLIYNVISIFYLLKQYSSQRIDIVYTRQSMLEFMPLFFMKRLGVRYVAEVNGIDREQKKLYGMAEWKIRLSECLFGMCYGFADAIVTVTDEIKEYLVKRYPETREKTYVVSNGANVEISRPVEKVLACHELGFDPGKTYVVFVGSLKKWHGVENAISVVEKLVQNHENMRLLVLGDGPEKSYLRSVVARKGLEENVTFLGKVKYDQVPLYIGMATACLALFDRERNDRTGLSPLKIFEYMACGRPVVTTDVGNLKSIIGRHNCGFVVKAGDIDAMSQAVLSLVGNSELAKELGDNGREAAVRYYSWHAISEKLLDIIYVAGKNS